MFQVIAARVNVGPLGERAVIVPGPLTDDGDGHAGVLHQSQGRVAAVVQGDPSKLCPLQHATELIGVPLAVSARFAIGPGGPVGGPEPDRASRTLITALVKHEYRLGKMLLHDGG